MYNFCPSFVALTFNHKGAVLQKCPVGDLQMKQANNVHVYTRTPLYHVQVYTHTHGTVTIPLHHKFSLLTWPPWLVLSPFMHTSIIQLRTLVCQETFYLVLSPPYSSFNTSRAYKVTKFFFSYFLTLSDTSSKEQNSWPLTRAISGSLATADSSTTSSCNFAPSICHVYLHVRGHLP